MRSILLSTAVAITAFISATSAFADDDLINKIKASGETKVAVGSAPPFVSISPTGEPIGYAVEVLQAALAGIGLPKITPNKTDWSAMIPGLQAHQYDLVAPGLTITEERCNAIIFSAPVWSMQFGIYTPSGNPNRFASTKEFANQTKYKAAVINGSSQDTYATKNGVADSQLVRVTDVQSGVAAVKGGRANAFIVGRLSVPDPEGKGLSVVTDQESPNFGYGIALRKEDIALRDALNQQIDAMRKDGRLKKLFSEKYNLPDWDAFVKQARASDFYGNCK